MDEGLVRQADALIDGGRPDDAIGLAGRALAADPDDSRALVVSARALLAVGRLDEAREAAARAVALDPGDTHALRLVSLIASSAGDGVAAREAAGRAVQLDAFDPRNQVVASRAASVAGDRDAAVAHALEAVRLAPDEPAYHVLVGRAVVERADGRRGRGRGEDLRLAEQAFGEALRLDPLNDRAQSGLGMARLLAGKTPEATRHLMGVLAQNPADTHALRRVDVAVYAIAYRLVVLAWLAVLLFLRLSHLLAGQGWAGLLAAGAVVAVAVAAACLVVRAVREGGLRLGRYVRGLRGRFGRLRTLLVSLSLGWAGLLAVAVCSAFGSATATGVASTLAAVALIVAASALLATRSALTKRAQHPGGNAR